MNKRIILIVAVLAACTEQGKTPARTQTMANLAGGGTAGAHPLVPMGGSGGGPQGTGYDDGSVDARLLPVHVNDHFIPAPPATDAQIQFHAECDGFSNDARTSFDQEKLSTAVNQCEVNADCKRKVFYMERDGCWSGCYQELGTAEYGSALKSLASDLCQSFFDNGCHVSPAGCAPPPTVPPTYACVDHRCKIVDAGVF